MHELETSRVRLRLLSPADLNQLTHIFSNPEVMKYLGPEGKPMSKVETENTLRSITNHWGRHGFGRWGVVLKGSPHETLIGCAGLRSYEGTAELVYLIDQPYWGLGLATEVAGACLRYGFEAHRFSEIIAFSRPQNSASRKVMEKIGMRFKEELKVFGIDVVKYILTREDFRPSESVFHLRNSV